MRSTWILELITRNLTSLIYYIYAENNYNDHRKEEKTMAKIDIISGFLGAGKTTLIKKINCRGFSGRETCADRE